MSELKVHRFLGRHEVCPYDSDPFIGNDYYLKSEADAVFAEKDTKIIILDAEVFKQKHHTKLFFDERNYAEAQLRHSNYKRCLAMAKLCHWKTGVFIYKKEKSDFYYRWYKRWLELAEKFKPNEGRNNERTDRT